MSPVHGHSFCFLVQLIVSCCVVQVQKILIMVAVMMVLRVSVMYGRSRTILITLLAVFSLGIISFILIAAVQSDPKTSRGM